MMENILNILFLASIAGIIFQIVLLGIYFKPFLTSAISGKFDNFNKSTDVAVLFLFLAAISWSTYGISNWNNKWWDLLILIMILFFDAACYFLIFRLRKQNDILKIKSSPFIELKPEQLVVLEDYLAKNKIFQEENLHFKLEKLLSNDKLDDPLVYSGKYNKNISYKYLFLLLKAIMKKDAFEQKTIFQIIKNSFLFEKKDTDTNEILIENYNSRTIENAFKSIDFSNLIDYQQKFYENCVNICKSDVSQLKHR